MRIQRSVLTFCVIAAAMLATGGGIGVAQTPQPDPSRARLYRDSRSELALARARGETHAMLVIASAPGANEAVAAVVKAQQGVVAHRDDDVSYLRVKLPLDAIERVLDTAPIESAALDVGAIDRRLFMSDGKGAATDGEAPADPWLAQQRPSAEQAWPPGQWSAYPMDQQYHPHADLGAADLLRKHPTYDGRGVTIGHVEMGLDLLLPEFETALTLDGKETPKVVEYFTVIESDHDHGDDVLRKYWVAMTDEVTATAGRISKGDKPLTAPRDGAFRLGIFEGRNFCSSLTKPDPDAPPVERQTGVAPPDPKCRFGVLWDQRTNDVWLDSNRNDSFADEKALTDFRTRRDFATIGDDDPSTRQRERYSFVVQTNKRLQSVAILVGNGGHSTMVAGSAAGRRGRHGRYDGVAPGAQLVEVDYGGACIGGVIEGLIAAFKDPRVDVVLFEQNVQMAMPYRPGDGRFTPTVITSRLVEKYQKPFTVPGDNSPGLNITSEHGNARFGFAVGAYEAKESYRVNDGFVVENADNLHHVGAWGPGGDGAVKPDILAPSGYLASAIPTEAVRGGVKGLYELPPAYRMGGGTSQATPTMAGALALLLSAAKQEKVPYDAERVWRAMTASARFIPHIPAHKQGNGLIDVAAAFELLKAYAKTPPLRIESRGPVRAPYSAWLTPPHEGVSLWERDGWRAGQRNDRTITFTRTDGPREPMTFALSWLGGDGTFTAPSTITLPLRQPVPLSISVATKSAGPHSALLSLDHPSTPGSDYRVLTTIVAGDAFPTQPAGGPAPAADAAGKPEPPPAAFSIVKKEKVARPGPSTSFFVDVPRNAAVLTVDSTGGRLTAIDPLGRRSSAPAGRKTVTYPMAGVWELGVFLTNDALDLAWGATGGEIAPPVAVSVTTGVLTAQITAPPEVALTAGASRPVEVTVVNEQAKFDGGLAAMPMGSVRTATERLRPREQRVYEVRVPEGSPFLMAQVTNPSAQDAEIDIYFFDCTGKRCTRPAAALGLGSAPRLRHESPKAGLWRIVVDAARVPADGLAFEYADIVADPALGSVSVTDASVSRDAGTRWTATANVWLAKRPDGDRRPYALLVVNAATKDGAAPAGFRMIPVQAAAGSAAR